MGKIVRTTITVLLIGSVGLLTYLCIMSIYSPIKFEKVRNTREAKIINRLVDIRKAQVEFKNENKHYTASLDSLIDFVNNGQIPIVLKEGTLTDEQLKSGLTEAEAAKKGIIRRDTSYVNVKESLFSENYNADSMRYVPYGNGAIFEMDAKAIPVSGMDVWVFEAKTPYDVYLKGINDQEVINLIESQIKRKRYPGLKVGSVEEANNNAGNWE